MIRYVLKRLLWMIPIIIVVSFAVYVLMDLAPGDFVDAIGIDSATPEEIAALRAQYGLDRPLVVRYARYMFNLVQGDLGTSYITRLGVWDTFIERLPNTLMLSAAGLIIGAAVSVPLGIRAAKRAGSISDNLTTTFTLVGMSMPGFWLGLLLLMLFSQNLGWLPAGGRQHGLSSFILPAVCSGLMLMASATRQTRSSMLEVLNADFLRTARAKGVPEKLVIRKHALGNAWIPILTTIGMSLSISLAGSVVIENVFAWPGIGRLLVTSVTTRDVPMTTGTVIMTTIVYVLILLIVDLSYAFVDPRIRSQYVTPRKRKKASALVVASSGDSSDKPALGTAFKSQSAASPAVAATTEKEPEAADIKAADAVPEKAAATTVAADSSAKEKEQNYVANRFVTRDLSKLTDDKNVEAPVDESAELVSRKYMKRSNFGELIHHIRQNKGAMAGLIIITFMILVALSSIFIEYSSVTAMSARNRFAPPSLQLPFGADNMGRNMFLRVVYGSRYSLIIGLGSTLMNLSIGVILGSIAGYFGGKVDDIIMRVSDTLASIPGMLLGIVIITVLGQTLMNLIIAVGIVGIPIYIRITRASILTVRNREFVEAARSIGLSNPRIIATQVLPNGLAPIIVTMTTSLGVTIIIAASLSFLGFGVPVPRPEWGALIANGKDFMRFAPWLTTFPGLFIMITVLGFNLLGDGLRDALDPKLKKR